MSVLDEIKTASIELMSQHVRAAQVFREQSIRTSGFGLSLLSSDELWLGPWDLDICRHAIAPYAYWAGGGPSLRSKNRRRRGVEAGLLVSSIHTESPVWVAV
ncbi:hypothetical protein [Jannaschia sp. CCS1]|uniref:hypothetical protein n=1 Tax=Jannaschia sp. (strain CCS1) TaxID=290400 RepID=UPI0005C4DA22|nr:hypothetical protein [Jannaschia sp. CCS1]